ncbi:hypothetical protein SB912_25210, partial [Pantoea sp. SIMBA_072]
MEIGVGFERSDIVDEKLDLFTAQGLAQAFGIIYQQRGADARVAFDEMAQGVGDQAHGQRRATAEMQLAGVELGHLQYFVAQLRGTLHQAAGVLQ